jgi:hypothetical protein
LCLRIVLVIATRGQQKCKQGFSQMSYTTLKAAKEDAGKLSLGNGKMPGSTFATDAFACKVGDKLAKVKGSVCQSCYARKIQKLRPSVNQGWTNNQRLAVQLIATAPHKWVAAMVFQVEKAAIKSGQPFHRWFDSGDLDSVDMLAAIVKVAKAGFDIIRESLRQFNNICTRFPPPTCNRFFSYPFQRFGPGMNSYAYAAKGNIFQVPLK